MASWKSSRLFGAVAGAVGLAAVAAAVWFALRPRADDPARPADPEPKAFRECAEVAGLSWRMSFLPGEQGEKFKINLYDHGSGLAVGDFDGDGHDDLYFCNQLGKNALYRNKGDGTFEDVTDKAGVGLGDRVCVAATFADYDNDGRQDLYVTSTRGGNVLFRNNSDGTFTDVTEKAGLKHVGHSQSAVFFDFDNDGLLDLFLTNTAKWTTDNHDKGFSHFAGKGDLSEVLLSPKEWNRLYRNNGDGTFIDVTKKAGLEGRGWAGDAVAFDYDGDGKMDLFVTCMVGRCQLYRNNGDGTFTDVTLKVLGRTPWGGMGANVLDFDNDGRLDLYAVDMHSDMWMGLDYEHRSLLDAKKFEETKFPSRLGPFWPPDDAGLEREKDFALRVGYRNEEVIYGNAFYRNGEGGRFTEASDAAGLETFWPWGIATGDFDNDGFEDLFSPAGMGYPYYYWPNYLLMNRGGRIFRNEAAKLGIEPPPRGVNLPERLGGRDSTRSSRSAVTADFTGSGRLDVVTNNFNDKPYYYRNNLPRKNYVSFRLRGTRGNRDAVGAVVRLYRGGKVLTRQVKAACGYLSQSSRALHFGLGDEAGIDRVEITWPGGRTQKIDGVSANTLHQVTEPGS